MTNSNAYKATQASRHQVQAPRASQDPDQRSKSDATLGYPMGERPASPIAPTDGNARSREWLRPSCRRGADDGLDTAGGYRAAAAAAAGRKIFSPAAHTRPPPDGTYRALFLGGTIYGNQFPQAPRPRARDAVGGLVVVRRFLGAFVSPLSRRRGDIGKAGERQDRRGKLQPWAEQAEKREKRKRRREVIGSRHRHRHRHRGLCMAFLWG
ncbi:hypothetical protein JOL62DRAFT_272916 [Phyllosticta paracitricarpa]|uniref:Uncharacterized protein n=1 Tax=Phyllosticta paracitricarpa TaxID=2016321 RepID=A0ABR1N0E0_9PEZI